METRSSSRTADFERSVTSHEEVSSKTSVWPTVAIAQTADGSSAESGCENVLVGGFDDDDDGDGLLGGLLDDLLGGDDEEEEDLGRRSGGQPFQRFRR